MSRDAPESRSSAVLRGLASNPAVPSDPAVEVRTAVSVRAGLTERQQADIDVTAAYGDGRYGSISPGIIHRPHRRCSCAASWSARAAAVISSPVVTDPRCRG
ncbi:hypothetical protein OHA72_58550 [Dactylosporangium sp. NBC_01737]|uniref:hypothetical protein n=1 Tax=Dactylosporangium sp. NBC_01737 TaxID=2975959 RepID=UPI002E1396BE|nr:hypothetical protein OHA72_58550 [Dactylosporangium sp. NBC_01737]